MSTIKCIFLLYLILFGPYTVYAQNDFVSARSWPMPEGHRNGLVDPAFTIIPTFELVSIGNQIELYLRTEYSLATAENPVPSFTYRYMKNGNIYTDKEISMNAFQGIKLHSASFKVVVQGPGINETVTYETLLKRKPIGFVAQNTKASQYTAHFQELVDIDYKDTERINQAISNYEAAVKQKEEEEKLAQKHAEEMKAAEEKKAAEQQPTNNQSSGYDHPNSKTSNPVESNSSDNFWNETDSSGNDKVVPHQKSHDKLPDMVRTTDGGYFQRGSDGQFREVTAEEYARAKQQRQSASGQKQEEQTVTTEEINASIQKVIADDQAYWDSVNEQIDQQQEIWQQNYYYAEAVRTGKQNLDQLSRLDGNYNSVAQLEADYNQQYNTIYTEVNNLEQARNAQLNNAVANTFNANATEQAIGETMQAVGAMVNSIRAEKEQREAQEALRREREKQLAAIEAAKRQARLDMRNKLLETFPDGGTPITAHKVTAPDVHLFAYVINRSTFFDEYASVSVSQVFSVPQYADGTYPYKTIVLNKINGIMTGEIILVGYYTDKSKANYMRNSFINLSKKSALAISLFEVKSAGVAGRGTGKMGDFWETGISTPDTTKQANSNNFWNN